MKQTINESRTGLSSRELEQLLRFTPETIASISKPKAFTAARYWSIERRRKLAADRRRASRGL